MMKAFSFIVAMSFVNPDFSRLHRRLVTLLHRAHHGSAGNEPHTTLGERQDRHARTKSALDSTAARQTNAQAQRHEVEALDQAMIQLLADQGYLKEAPKVKSKTLQQISRAVGSAELKLASAISISHDDTGRVQPLIPNEEPATWRDRPSLDSWSHWGTLLHEAAHCTLATLPRPFQTERLDQNIVEDLNAFLLGPLADARGFFHKALNESFADVYSAMLLDTLGHGDPGMLQEVDNLRFVRQHVREHDFDPSLARGELVMSAPHQTDLALSLAWDERQSWKGRAPSVMVAAAQRYASEGLIALMTPGRLLAPGVTMDDRLIRYLESEFVTFLTKGPLVSMVAHEVITPQRSRLADWRAAYPDHPALALMDVLVEKLRGPGDGPLYATLETSQRYGAACAFLERAVKSRGSETQKEVGQRSHRVGEELRMATRLNLRLEPMAGKRRRVHP